MKVCSIEGCIKPLQARGYCSGHYKQWRKSCDPSEVRPKRKPGEGNISAQGYRVIARKYEHRIVAERAFGRPLPRHIEVHHVNEDPLDNRPRNLVICTKAYHKLLHVRQAALTACGNADWRRCELCRRYDAPENLFIRPNKNHVAVHRECRREYERELKRRNAL